MSDGSIDTARAATERGGLRAVLAALPRGDARAVLAIVVATSGSTYRKPGALIVLGEGAREGWMSGGCLEAELELAGRETLAAGAPRRVSFNTQGDDDLVFGSASGCRGEIHLLLLPVDSRAPLVEALRAFDAGGAALELELREDGAGRAALDGRRWQWSATFPSATSTAWSLRLAPPPRVLLLGAGPETATLVRYAQALGWRVDAVEQRGRWHDAVRFADSRSAAAPRDVAALAAGCDAAIVMSHHYSNDRDYLAALAQVDVAFVGLLGPPARRDALLAELGPDVGARLRPRLHAPVGLRLGGEGPEAIALAIVAGLQQHFATAHS
jgi:xanthine dehydrogenase accessory factor